MAGKRKMPQSLINYFNRKKAQQKLVNARRKKLGIKNESLTYGGTPIQGIDPETGEVVVEFRSLWISRHHGYKPGAISLALKGERLKKHRGLIWRKKNEH